ncbi:hypothetical protein XENOCAPTIV_010726, partial [Xenoophorus captivus]
ICNLCVRQSSNRSSSAWSFLDYLSGFCVHSRTEQSSSSTGPMLHYDKRTPADLSTLQRNSSFTLRSLPTESTSAVNSNSVSLTPSPLADTVSVTCVCDDPLIVPLVLGAFWITCLDSAYTPGPSNLHLLLDLCYTTTSVLLLQTCPPSSVTPASPSAHFPRRVRVL